MKKIVLSALLACSAPAFACSAIAPESAFMMNYDKNKDGVLSNREFKKVKSSKTYKTTFKMANTKTYLILNLIL